MTHNNFYFVYPEIQNVLISDCLVFENDGLFSSRKLTHAITVVEDERVREFIGDLDINGDLSDK